MNTRYFEDLVRALTGGVTEIYYHPGAEMFDIDAAHTPDPANSYQQWLARQDKRAVQG